MKTASSIHSVAKREFRMSCRRRPVELPNWFGMSCVRNVVHLLMMGEIIPSQIRSQVLLFDVFV